jgi:AcrR family transcriptional regulator
MMSLSEWTQIQAHILGLEQEGLVTRTFRRLDPERQQAVLSALLQEAMERGPAGINIKEVAARAKVSVGSLYQYFHSRDRLLDFAVELCARYLVDEMNRYRPLLAAMPLREGLEWYIKGGIEWSQMGTGLTSFFVRAAYQGDPDLAQRLVAPMGRVMRDTVHEMLRQASSRGEIRHDADLDAAARVVNVLTIAVADSHLLPYLNHYTQLTDESMVFKRVLDAMLDLIMEGLSPRKDG